MEEEKKKQLLQKEKEKADLIRRQKEEELKQAELKMLEEQEKIKKGLLMYKTHYFNILQNTKYCVLVCYSHYLYWLSTHVHMAMHCKPQYASRGHPTTLSISGVLIYMYMHHMFCYR